MLPVVRPFLIACFAAVSLSICSPPAKAFDMGLSPARVEESLKPGSEKTIVWSLTNGSPTQNLRVQVLIYDWAVDEHGALQSKPPGSYPYSSSDWVEVSPAEFVVKPRQTQLVRGTFKVPADAKSGDYLTSLLFRQRVIVPPAKARVTGQLIPEGLIGSLVYINVPGSDKKPSLEGMRFIPPTANSPAKIEWSMKNDGTEHVRPSGNIQIKDSSEKTVLSEGLKDLSVLLRNSKGVRDYPLVGLPAGKYQAILNLDLDPDQYKYEKGVLNFDMPAPVAVKTGEHKSEAPEVAGTKPPHAAAAASDKKPSEAAKAPAKASTAAPAKAGTAASAKAGTAASTKAGTAAPPKGAPSVSPKPKKK